jgi:hypothetical protein
VFGVIVHFALSEFCLEFDFVDSKISKNAAMFLEAILLLDLNPQNPKLIPQKGYPKKHFLAQSIRKF